MFSFYQFCHVIQTQALSPSFLETNKKFKICIKIISCHTQLIFFSWIKTLELIGVFYLNFVTVFVLLRNHDNKL